VYLLQKHGYDNKNYYLINYIFKNKIKKTRDGNYYDCLLAIFALRVKSKNQIPNKMLSI